MPSNIPRRTQTRPTTITVVVSDELALLPLLPNASSAHAPAPTVVLWVDATIAEDRTVVLVAEVSVVVVVEVIVPVAAREATVVSGVVVVTVVDVAVVVVTVVVVMVLDVVSVVLVRGGDAVADLDTASFHRSQYKHFKVLPCTKFESETAPAHSRMEEGSWSGSGQVLPRSLRGPSMGTCAPKHTGPLGPTSYKHIH